MILTTRYEGNIFLCSVMKNCVFVFGKDVLSTRNQVFSLRRSNFLRVPTRQSLLVFSEKKSIQKSLKKIVFFSESVNLKKTKQKQNQNIYTQIFRQCYVQRMRKISGKISKPYIKWNSWNFSFLNKRHGFGEEQVSIKNHSAVFFTV